MSELSLLEVPSNLLAASLDSLLTLRHVTLALTLFTPTFTYAFLTLTLATPTFTLATITLNLFTTRLRFCYFTRDQVCPNNILNSLNDLMTCWPDSLLA